MIRSLLLVAGLSLGVTACSHNPPKPLEADTSQRQANQLGVATKAGAYTIFEQGVDSILDFNADIEELATGFIWTEGPLWLASQNCLLFSDIPNNKVMRYCPETGLDTYLNDSGNSNGLILNRDGELVLMQSGTRQVALMSTTLDKPAPNYQTLTSKYDGKKLNSPNDATLSANGELYFTDPPYGLPDQLNDPRKELDFQGVYRLATDGELSLLDASLKYPNGISLIDNDSQLIVSVSDPDAPSWYLYDVNSNGLLENRRTFANAQDYQFARGTEGLPDGLKQHRSGAIFASGPGGVWIFNTSATLLAHLAIEGPVANLAFDEAEEFLYLTSQDRLLRIKLR